MYFDSGISERTVVVQATIAIISFMTAYQLFFKKDRLITCYENQVAETVRQVKERGAKDKHH